VPAKQPVGIVARIGGAAKQHEIWDGLSPVQRAKRSEHPSKLHQDRYPRSPRYPSHHGDPAERKTECLALGTKKLGR